MSAPAVPRDAQYAIDHLVGASTAVRACRAVRETSCASSMKSSSISQRDDSAYTLQSPSSGSSVLTTTCSRQISPSSHSRRSPFAGTS